MSDITDLIGKPLNEFRLVSMTEIYQTNESGHHTKTIGCLSDVDLATAYACNLPDPDFTDVQEVLVLTDGKVGYIASRKEAILLDAEAAQEAVRNKALSKLTLEEIRVLGIV